MGITGCLNGYHGQQGKKSTFEYDAEVTEDDPKTNEVLYKKE